MELLFKREQTAGKIVKVQFKLWGKVELTEEEQTLINKYRFHDAILIAVLQPYLLKQIAFVGGAAFIFTFLLLSPLFGNSFGFLLAATAGGGAAYWYLNEKRETIFVKDLIHGRYFSCSSVVELARKEAWLEYVTAYLRQVMESAKHWDGTQRHTIEPLPKDEARKVILEGL